MNLRTHARTRGRERARERPRGGALRSLSESAPPPAVFTATVAILLREATRSPILLSAYRTGTYGFSENALSAAKQRSVSEGP